MESDLAILGQVRCVQDTLKFNSSVSKNVSQRNFHTELLLSDYQWFIGNVLSIAKKIHWQIGKDSHYRAEQLSHAQAPDLAIWVLPVNGDMSTGSKVKHFKALKNSGNAEIFVSLFTKILNHNVLRIFKKDITRHTTEILQNSAWPWTRMFMKLVTKGQNENMDIIWNKIM